MRLQNLAGQRFGFLSVIRRIPNIGGKVSWLCRCDCGKTVAAKSRDLLLGRQTSCGCQWKKKGISRLHYVEGTCLEIILSKTVRRNSESGVTGVHYDQTENNWRAEIMFQGKRHYLGRFKEKEDAIAARRKAELELYGPLLEKYGRL